MLSTSIISPVYEAENIINELARRVEFEIQKSRPPQVHFIR